MRERKRNRLEGCFDSTLGYPGEGPPRNLQKTHLDPKYRRALQKALGRLQVYAAHKYNSSVSDRISDAKSANKFLIAYIQDCYDKKLPMYYGVHAILCIQHRRRALKGHLRQAWDSIESWKQEVKTQSRIPMPRPVVEAVIGKALMGASFFHYSGNEDAAALLYSWSVLVWLMYDGLLRPGEGYALRRGDVHLRSSGGRQEWAVTLLCIRNPKNARAFGYRQFVIIDGVRLGRWATWLLTGVPRECRVFTGSRRLFNIIFHQILESLGLGTIGFTPASLRAGGATSLFLRTRNIAIVRFTGRWRSDLTLTHYLQEAVSAFILASMPEDLAKRLCRYGDLLYTIFRQPPREPWFRVFSREKQHRRALTGLRLAHQMSLRA